MKEFVTQALVLGVRSLGESDRAADLFTLALGRCEARMVAGRAIVSKFAPHTDPLNLLTVRLVKKGRYTLADAVAENRFPVLRRSAKAFAEALEAFFALKVLIPKEEPDPRLFHEVCRALTRGRLTTDHILSLLGYEPREARCDRCRKPAVRYFIPRDGVFFCGACSKGMSDEVVLQVTTSHYGS
ncbi:MAG: recombination protein O N-terminal domain-containing protein [Candidatus Jorgensenbacteria bacterium]|nr:recombination protein O N-terminal domain-containing protein [Candidatus Jorgensenbacteria bacterium]